MPLPFLKNQNRNTASVIISHRKPDVQPDPQDESSDAGLESAMGDLKTAMESGDMKSMAAAFRAASQILGSEPDDEPSDETPGDEDNSFAAQNIKAAQERR